MEDFLAGLLSIVFEVFGEALLQLAVEVIIALADRSVRSVSDESKAVNPVFAIAGYLSLGVAVGFVSLVLFPYPIFHPSKFHGVSLLASPILTGLAMSLMGTLLRRKGKQAMRIESFGYGFTFALGMAVMRFFFVAY